MQKLPRLLLPLVLTLACSGARSDAGDDPHAGQPPDASSHAVLSPGTCGYQETADSVSRETCRKRFRTANSSDSATYAPSDCAFQETTTLDSLHACLTRGDSVARACPVVQSWRVRQSDGFTREAEWRRCGPQGGAFVGDSIVWPQQFLVLRQDSVASSRAVYIFSNTEEPGISGLDTAVVIDLDGDGADELLFVNRIYGTGAAYELCALTVVGGRIRCWSGPDFPEHAAFLASDETLFKGWLQTQGPPGTAPDSNATRYLTGKSLWFTSPVYHQGDANCCPTANASLWLEALPRKGKFDRGLVLRTREDSTGAILAIDTLLR